MERVRTTIYQDQELFVEEFRVEYFHRRRHRGGVSVLLQDRTFKRCAADAESLRGHVVIYLGEDDWSDREFAWYDAATDE